MPELIKPPYKGSYIGQVFKTNGAVISKIVSYQKTDKETEESETRYGKIVSQQYIELIWDGKDWISRRDFSLKFMRAKHFKKEQSK
jgi:hypothetical protein